MPQVVSANRLTDGIVVFVGRNGEWVELLKLAKTFDGKAEVEAAIEEARKDVSANKIVDIFAFDVTVTGEKIAAVTLRDAIRTSGPTVHLDHGKQAVAG